MYRSLALAGSLFLAGCAAAPRDVAIAGLDLADPVVIARVSEGLAQKQRAAFATFALLHWPESKAYCGRPMFKGDAQPRTIGEAIDRTLEFETALERKRIEERQAGSAFEQQVQRKQQLVNEFEMLMIERQMLTSAAVTEAQKDSLARELDRKLSDNRKARDTLAAVPAMITSSAP